MENINNFLYQASKRIIVPVLTLIVVLSSNTFGACLGDVQRGGGILCSSRVCAWGRSDGRCNDDSDVCPGMKCNSFGYAEPCC